MTDKRGTLINYKKKKKEGEYNLSVNKRTCVVYTVIISIHLLVVVPFNYYLLNSVVNLYIFDEFVLTVYQLTIPLPIVHLFGVWFAATSIIPFCVRRATVKPLFCVR